MVVCLSTVSLILHPPLGFRPGSGVTLARDFRALLLLYSTISTYFSVFGSQQYILISTKSYFFQQPQDLSSSTSDMTDRKYVTAAKAESQSCLLKF